MGEEKRSGKREFPDFKLEQPLSGADAITEFGNAGGIGYKVREKRREVLGWRKQVGLDILSRVLEGQCSRGI